jgi:hypothetical protein
MAEDQDPVVEFDGEDAEYWNRLLGPAYDTAGLEQRFGLTPEMIGAMAESTMILKLETSDGMTVFPAFCFSETGGTVPCLPEVVSRLMAREFISPWSVAAWLNAHPDEWDGRSAVELLRTEWADEVVTQAGEHGRSPLWARTKQAEQMAIARLILDCFAELVADLLVEVAIGTLFVTRETDVPYGVFAMTLGEGPHSMRTGRFRVDGNPEQRAKDLAALVAARIAGTAND